MSYFKAPDNQPIIFNRGHQTYDLHGRLCNYAFYIRGYGLDCGRIRIDQELRPDRISCTHYLIIP